MPAISELLRLELISRYEFLIILFEKVIDKHFISVVKSLNFCFFVFDGPIDVIINVPVIIIEKISTPKNK